VSRRLAIPLLLVTKMDQPFKPDLICRSWLSFSASPHCYLEGAKTSLPRSCIAKPGMAVVRSLIGGSRLRSKSGAEEGP
jgi:hypothetical protein